MKMTTLCYIERDNQYLMLHRIKKEEDENRDKWVGVGGKFEAGESPEECLLREVQEETGLVLQNYRFRGIVTFVSAKWGTQYMHLFTARCGEDCAVTAKENDEGILEWVDKSKIQTLNIWEGDKIFLKLLEERQGFFNLKLQYDEQDILINKQLWKYENNE